MRDLAVTFGLGLINLVLRSQQPDPHTIVGIDNRVVNLGTGTSMVGKRWSQKKWKLSRTHTGAPSPALINFELDNLYYANVAIP